ncbi:MAG: hypothetical protein ACM358_03980 [Gemmatimonadota bacterium]
MNVRILLGIVVAVLCACVSAERKEEASSDVPDSSPAVETPATDVVMPPSSFGGEYVIHGYCPYLCCNDGKSTMINAGTLRTSYSVSADSVYHIDAGAQVKTDSGVMILHPPGLAILVGAASFAGLSGPQPGDTVEVLNSVGEPVTRLRWRGQVLELSNAAQVQVLSEPARSWWVYTTDSASQRSGWMLAGGVRADVTRAGEPRRSNDCKR